MQVYDRVFSLQDVSFRFPDDASNTLNDISFSISRGERVVISGPSGCGKSTLLYLLNRLYPLNCDGITSGAIHLFGKNAEHYAPGEINHRVATVFQDPDSQFCMPTVEEELAFTLENLHVPFAEMDPRIAEVLQLTGLSHLRQSVIQSLSGGMKQRVATACALIMEPEVLLLDEPISHLDPYMADQFIEWLDELQKSFNVTIVAVEHRLDLWGSFFNRELVMDSEGNMVADSAFAIQQPVLFPEWISAAGPETALTANEISVRMKDEELLLPMSFIAKRGEVVVIAGPNGSGKSTLMKALCGIYAISGGTVKSDGAGYVPQSPEYLFLEKTVAAELAFSGVSSANELEELMERLRLKEIRDAHPFSVSHGQKRRIAIGAMLADKRPVLLMDEPTSGQDTAALLELFELITERAREGVTIFIITHDMEFAASVADSVLLIKDGHLTGKFKAAAVWNDETLLAEHHLLPPKGVQRYAESFA
ncbi:ABC transporter ATP-binding protein [Planococcus shenhongbingii]|uniref:ATP-binding cassette domain-containing protein n=1 Tax=Planococcus shenhongbingii TaxID=3058398 RepID=A0ABT8N8Q5_9BACL|nr:ATP-binding cassette domain-containing protein [Planococcus sp. N017]MDN7243920.1 ATP-binding cassette domain-containing protein [Planococcus sp. N017]